jgi:hypothetical protein
VLLTPLTDLDGGTIKIFLDRLDRGWEHYAATVGVGPARSDGDRGGRFRSGFSPRARKSVGLPPLLLLRDGAELVSVRRSAFVVDQAILAELPAD